MHRQGHGDAGFEPFSHGQVIALRYRRNQPADVVMPVRVVADAPKFEEG